MQQYDIVIAGAGPTGLMLACQLSRFGVNFLILDKKSGPTSESRALVVQARSMEIYEQMGLSGEVEREGQPSGGISLYKKGKKAASVFLKTMGEGLSPFPYVMIYEQSKNETLLNNHLQSRGNNVLWGAEITNIKETDGGYVIETVQAAGGTTNFGCKYLVACDGSKSIVREFAGMAFTGGTYENVFYVADTHVKATGIANNMLSLFLTKQAITFFFPLPGPERVRLLGILPKEYYHHDTIQFDGLISHVKEVVQMPVEFYNTNWYSTYKLHHKKVEHFNKGNIFFAGDAAHVHSPAGGQGMNTGLQDAYNLAWKLALVSKGHADNALLNTYHEERNPIAERLLKTTDRAFTIMTNSNAFFGFIKLFVVPRVVPFFNKFKRMRTLWFSEVSQIKINYKKSSLANGQAGKIRAGIRFPYFKVSHQGNVVSVFQLIRQYHTKPFIIMLYGVPEDGFATFDKELFSVLSFEVNAANNETLKQQGFSSSFVVVLRPDVYIGCVAEKVDVDEIKRFMKECYYLTEA